MRGDKIKSRQYRKKTIDEEIYGRKSYAEEENKYLFSIVDMYSGGGYWSILKVFLRILILIQNMPSLCLTG